MSEADPAVELRAAGQTCAGAGRPDEDDAQVAAVDAGADPLDAGGVELISLVTYE
ncbi:hypothetical protein [Streptomyces sp. A5-4]|uniref:hypothetical protein n=1 Tax=Streptomyces sp. A5-4 TaxID=3384771 RepID=UPI003DA92CBD